MPDSPPTDLNDAATVVRTQAALLSRGPLADAAAALAVELAQALRCDRVSVGMLNAGRLEVVGTSQGREVDPRMGVAQAVTAAMNEALDQSATLSHPRPTDGVPMITLSHQLLAGPSGGAACTVPARGNDGVVGAVTLERSSPHFSAAEIALCEDVASFAGPVWS